MQGSRRMTTFYTRNDHFYRTFKTSSLEKNFVKKFVYLFWRRIDIGKIIKQNTSFKKYYEKTVSFVQVRGNVLLRIQTDIKKKVYMLNTCKNTFDQHLLPLSRMRKIFLKIKSDIKKKLKKKENKDKICGSS